MKRTWYSGPPPHIGWWNASKWGHDSIWRWWDGKRWSGAANDNQDYKFVGSSATVKDHTPDIKWSSYWPINGRVPRINPATGEVTGKVKMNTNENPKTLALVDTWVDTATDVAKELIRLELVELQYEALKAEIVGNSDDSAIYKVQSLKRSERALAVWSDKSEWVRELLQRTGFQPSELGMHLADVARARMEKLEKSNQHLVTALKLIKSAESTAATVEYVKGIAQSALWKSGQK